MSEATMIIFEDKQIEHSVLDVVRSRGFQRLKGYIVDEAVVPEGKPVVLADAITSALRAYLVEPLEDA